MALPISISECLSLVTRGVRLYNKIKHEVPDQIADVAERIENLELYLRRLQTFLQDHNLLVSNRPTEKADLETILGKTRGDVSKVIDILEKWKNNVAPGGLQFRWKFVAQAQFAVGGKPDELEDLGKRLDRRQDEIRDWQGLLLLWGQAQMLNANNPPPSRSASPGPRSDYNLMFIDADNRGRSVVAEAYGKLCCEWTTRTGGVWPVRHIHSAGLNVKDRSNTATVQQRLGMNLYNGNKPPLTTAMSALFDRLKFTYQYKNDIRNRLAQRRSRGLTQDLFATYDFVIVFNRNNLASLENLRDALSRKHGQAPPRGKGRLILLGEYSNTGSKEIYNPTRRKGPDFQDSAENWFDTVSNIQTSFKNFLMTELAWVRPTPGSRQDA